jgi:protein tyrosine/serine phosphatase
MRTTVSRQALSSSFVLFLGILAPATLAQTNTANPVLHIKRFGRVNASYYRGAEPTQHEFANLAALGIRTIVDLKNDGIRRESAIVRQSALKFYSIPMSTSSAPSDDAVAQFLRIVDDPANGPVFVHCEGGHDRTGAMTAIYRITHDGWTVARAYGEMKQYGYDGALSGPALKDFVFNYARRHTPQKR